MPFFENVSDKFFNPFCCRNRELALKEIGQAHRLQSVGYIGRKSIERRQRPNPNMEHAGLSAETLSEEEKRRLTEELLTEIPDRYSMDNVKEYFDQMTFDKGRLSVEECRVHTRDDAMMIAASMIYSGTAGFPYEVEFEKAMVETEVVAISRQLC